MDRPAAAQIFASIDDLLIQVFLRLPLKQLYQFKLVSKHWDSIISDSKLLLSLRNPEPAAGLIFNCRVERHHDLHSPYESYILYFNRPTIPKQIQLNVQVLHSCNGLLLFTCSMTLSGPKHYIYNPTSLNGRFSTLDPGTGEGPRKSTLSICGMYLAFDPSKSCHYKYVCVVGLGRENSYISLPRSYDRFKFEVYSSETGSWRKCGEPFSGTVDFEESGVYWKGAIHWVSLKKSGDSIYFNPDDENDRMLPTVMPSPPILEDAKRRENPFGAYWKNPSPLYKGRNYHFGESCGHLNFIDSFREEFEFNVYEMKTDYSEWFVKYRVDLSNVGNLFSICTLVRGNKDDDTFFVLRVGKKFVRCNLVDKACETIFECEGDDAKLEKELLGDDGEFPLQYIEGAYGNIDGVWSTENPATAGWTTYC